MPGAFTQEILYELLKIAAAVVVLLMLFLIVSIIREKLRWKRFMKNYMSDRRQYRKR